MGKYIWNQNIFRYIPNFRTLNKFCAEKIDFFNLFHITYKI